MASTSPLSARSASTWDCQAFDGPRTAPGLANRVKACTSARRRYSSRPRSSASGRARSHSTAWAPRRCRACWTTGPRSPGHWRTAGPAAERAWVRRLLEEWLGAALSVCGFLPTLEPRGALSPGATRRPSSPRPSSVRSPWDASPPTLTPSARVAGKLPDRLESQAPHPGRRREKRVAVSRSETEATLVSTKPSASIVRRTAVSPRGDSLPLR